ncbi:MAG: iron-containing alcohol dehydrogenase [Sedimentisphaerales bacterium]|nr:iron-containing alcohol dehydrogenase [Sedimentisphaerales bacterium]
MTVFDEAKELLLEFKGESYLFGCGVLEAAGSATASLGRRAALVRGTFPGSDDCVASLGGALARAGASVVTEIKGARPNAPREDVLRIAAELRAAGPEVLVSLGGGSLIDATKAADVLRTLEGDVEDYFGTALVTRALEEGGKKVTPHVAIQTLAGSAAHLTKYSNVTDYATGQKKLIVDDAIVPVRPVFDYDVTRSAPKSLTADGAFDGISHILEVLYGAAGKPHYEKAAQIAWVGLPLALQYLPQALDNPDDAEARTALGLATDLGGYAIMIGGTNGGHLTSFSLVDLLPHGRSCALMNPYYTVFFAPAIEQPLRLVAELFGRAGWAGADVAGRSGRALGIAVAEAMMRFADSVGFPTKLANVEGFGPTHIERALAAAKDPQLKMKLENMPIPLTAGMVDEYMGSVLEAARDGDLEAVRNVP